MLYLAVDVAVAATGGTGYQRVGSRANVQLLHGVRGGDSSVVEEIGDQVSDYPVRV